MVAVATALGVILDAVGQSVQKPLRIGKTIESTGRILSSSTSQLGSLAECEGAMACVGEYIKAAGPPRQPALSGFATKIHLCVRLLLVAPIALREEHMAQWDMRSLALYVSEVQETGQWDLRSVYSYFPLVVLFVFLFFVVIPIVQILCRTGHNPVWRLLALVPGLNILAFWFLAFKPWPTDKHSANKEN